MKLYQEFGGCGLPIPFIREVTHGFLPVRTESPLPLKANIADLYEFNVWYSNPVSSKSARKCVTNFTEHRKGSICLCVHQLTNIFQDES